MKNIEDTLWIFKVIENLTAKVWHNCAVPRDRVVLKMWLSKELWNANVISWICPLQLEFTLDKRKDILFCYVSMTLKI